MQTMFNFSLLRFVTVDNRHLVKIRCCCLSLSSISCHFIMSTNSTLQKHLAMFIYSIMTLMIVLLEKKKFLPPPSRHGFYFVVSRHFSQFCFCRPPVTTRFCIFSGSAYVFLISNLILISIVILYITIDHQNRKEIFYKTSKKI